MHPYNADSYGTIHIKNNLWYKWKDYLEANISDEEMSKLRFNVEETHKFGYISVEHLYKFNQFITNN